jgi:hypothetical protein
MVSEETRLSIESMRMMRKACSCAGKTRQYLPESAFLPYKHGGRQEGFPVESSSHRDLNA